MGIEPGVLLLPVGGPAEYLSVSGQRPLTCLALSDDASRLLVGGFGVRATLFKRDIGEQVKLVGKGIGEARHLALTGDGQRALHARALFEADGSKLEGGFGYRSGFASEDAVIIAVEGRQVTVRRLDDGSEETTELPSAAECFAASRAGGFAVGLAAVVEDGEVTDVGTVAISDGESLTFIKVLDDYEVNSVAISRDGARVAIGGFVEEEGPVGGVRLLRGAKLEEGVLPFQPPVSHSGLAFSPSGDRLTAISPGNLVRITDLGDPSRFWELAVARGAKAPWRIRAWDGRVEGRGIDGLEGTPAEGVLCEALGEMA